VVDLRRQFQLPASVSDNIPEQYEVYALSLQGSMLLLDTDDSAPGQRIFRLTCPVDACRATCTLPQLNWATLRREGTSYVELAGGCGTVSAPTR